MKETVLLIDGDIIAYRAAAACEKRTVVVKHEKSGVTKEFDTRTDFKKYLKEKNWEHRIKEYSFTDVQTPDELENCLHTIKVSIEKLNSITFADRKEIYLSGKDNFRLNLPLPTQYKSNRKDNLRPLLLQAAKDYLSNYHDAIIAKRIEADDILSVRGYEEIGKGNIAIIGSNDKDTLQGEGLYMYDWTVKEPALIEVPIIGELTKNKSIIKGMGLKFFAFQLLAGDTADFYCPYELTDVKYGAVSAYDDLNDLEFADEILQKVISKYKEWYPEPFSYQAWDGKIITADWKFMLDLYFKCAYMKRSWNDPSNWELFFAERGVYAES